MVLTGGAGVDVAIEAVGGTIANVGIHGAKEDLHLERLWAHNITLTTRLVDTITTPMLMKIVQANKLNPRELITHRFKLADMLGAYDNIPARGS